MQPHPKQTPNLPARIFLLGFDRAVRSLFHIEESGLPENIPQPCLIAANHRRDADIPILGVFLGHRVGWKITGVLPRFVAREDLFYPDFLWHYWSSPWLLGPRLISPLIPLDRILKVFKAHPIHRIPEQSLAIVLRDIRQWLGDLPLGTVLNRWWSQRLAGAGVDLNQPISWLLRREHQFEELIGGGWGHRRLNRKTFASFKPIERRRIDEHLAVFSHALAAGEAVMVAPEGANSPDGYFQRPRAGAYRLAQTASGGLPVMPVGIAYDPSAVGRMRVFVHAGEPFRADDFIDRRTFDMQVAQGILRATTVTGSHVVAHYALHAKRDEILTQEKFALFAHSIKGVLTAAGLRVAPDAADQSGRRLEWLARAGLIEPVHCGWRLVRKAEPKPGWDNKAALAVFLRNELRSVASLASGIAFSFGLDAPPYAPW